MGLTMTKVNKLQTSERKFDWEARLFELVRGWGEVTMQHQADRVTKANTSVTYRKERIGMSARILRGQPEYTATLMTRNGHVSMTVYGSKTRVWGTVNETDMSADPNFKLLYQLLERKLHSHLVDWLCADILSQGDNNYSYWKD